MDAKQQRKTDPQKRLSGARIESVRAEKGLIRLSVEDEAFIVDRLAEILLLDYEANQAVSGSTVGSPSHLDRKAGGEVEQGWNTEHID